MDITKNQRGKGNSMKKKVVYLVLTDAVGSSELDNRTLNPVDWRKKSFKNQLLFLLKYKKSLALKSVGDSLFVIYKTDGNNSEEDITVKKILNCVLEAFKNNTRIPIRCAIHRITGHKQGGEIANDLNSLRTLGDKKLLIKTLREDIFGKEVNRAARIISLVHNPAILVSEDVVMKICKNADEKASQFEPIEFGNENGKLIHSPVPVLYMKGVFEYKKEKNQKPYVVWELGEKEKPTLMPEFKCNQALRLITVRLKKAERLSQKIDGIVNNTLEKLSLHKPDLKLKFYIDMLWKVEDYFILRDPSFERIDRGKTINNKDYLLSLSNLIPTARKKGGALQKNGQIKKLNIKATIKGIEEITWKNDLPNNEFVIPLLAFTTFPDFEHKKRTRDLLSKEDLKHDQLISEIEPQSIDIFENIKIIDKNLINENSWNVLLLFQVFSEFIKQAHNLEKLFEKVEENINEIKVACYGLTTGFTDGFVLYTCPQKWENGLKLILTKIIGDQLAESFYHKIYPIGIFILKQVREFHRLNINIQCLKKLSKKKKR